MTIDSRYFPETRLPATDKTRYYFEIEHAFDSDIEVYVINEYGDKIRIFRDDIVEVVE